jgi:2',3'-cyclic-nucleotide 2'-phosphodiesterase/3'-nucleotidase/5'-nucleotidase
MFAPLLLLAALAAPPPDTAHVVIVSTTDVHGRAFGWDYTADSVFPGGLARVATVVDSLRRAWPGQVLLLDAGDLIQGDPFAAYYAREAPRDTNPIVRAMNAVGYDVATPGNHEFNWGLATLRQALGAASYRYVSGNLRGLPGDTLMLPAFVVLERAGVRIGVTGFTTPGVMVWDRANVRGAVRVAPIEPSAAPVLEQLRRRADLAVVVIHSGMDGGSTYDTAGVGAENVAARFAAMKRKPDLVVVGHSHREMRDSVLGGVHFVQPSNWARSVSVMHVRLVRRGNRWTPVRWHADLVPLEDVAPAPRITRLLAGAHDSARQWVRQPLGEAVAAMPLARSRLGPTPVIGFIHAVQRRHTGAQLSAATAFAERGGLPKGPIRLADVAGIYPYENTLRAVRLSGAQLKAFLEHSARYYRLDSAGRAAPDPDIQGYNFDMVSGASYAIDLARPAGSRITGLAVGGRPVAPADTFTMALHSYRQGGGGGYAMLPGAPVVYDRGENLRDLLVAEVRARGRIDPREFADSNWRLLPVSAVAAPPAVRLRILATSDLHGALQPAVHSWSKGRPVGGIVAIDRLMDSLEAVCDCPTLRLDGGDQMQGTLISNLAYGRSTVAAFNALGLDAAAVGNHDFDWSPDTLRARMREAAYPWLGANVFDSLTGLRPGWIASHAVVQAGGLRVAVIGYMAPETKSIVRAEHVRGLVFRAGAAAIRDVLDSARATRPDAVVIVAHAGAVCARTCEGDIIALARELPPGAVDAIVAGHTHQPVEAVVNGIPIVQARSSGTAVGVLDLPARGAADTSAISLLEPWADAGPGDSALTALLAGYAHVADSLGSRIVARLARPLPKTRELGGQYPLGNLLADAQRAAARADAAIMNNGGIRGTGLPEGPVSYRQLFELQPFANQIVALEVPGRILRAAVEHAIERDGVSAHVSGLRARYDLARPGGRRVVELRLEDGRPVRDDRTYTVAVNDFMAGGGSGYTMFVPFARKTAGLDLDVLIDYLVARRQPVSVSAEPRLTPATR